MFDYIRPDPVRRLRQHLLVKWDTLHTHGLHASIILHTQSECTDTQHIHTHKVSARILHTYTHTKGVYGYSTHTHMQSECTDTPHINTHKVSARILHTTTNTKGVHGYSTHTHTQSEYTATPHIHKHKKGCTDSLHIQNTLHIGHCSIPSHHLHNVVCECKISNTPSTHPYSACSP